MHFINSFGDVITLKDPLKAAYVEDVLDRIGEGQDVSPKERT